MSERLTVAKVHDELTDFKDEVRDHFREVEEKINKNQMATVERLIQIEIYQKISGETLDKINLNVEKLKDEPRTKWNMVISTALTVTVSVIVTYVLVRLGLK